MADNTTIDDFVQAEWCDILGLSRPSPEDDFFDLGGNSLLAVTLIERIEARLDAELPLGDFFLDGRLSVLLDSARAAAR